jgi:hypothetical protein
MERNDKNIKMPLATGSGLSLRLKRSLPIVVMKQSNTAVMTKIAKPNVRHVMPCFPLGWVEHAYRDRANIADG